MSASARYIITRLEQGKRIPIYSGKVNPKKITIDKNTLKRSWFNDLTKHYYMKDSMVYSVEEYEILEKKYRKGFERIVMFDFDTPEPLVYEASTKKWSNGEWSQEVEDIVIHTIQRQRIEVAASAVFMFSPETVRYILIMLIIGLGVGSGINDLFHFVPNTIIHWLP